MNNNNIIYKYEPLWDNRNISRFLGSGNFGVVYTLSKNTSSNDLSVLKFLTIPTEDQNKIISEFYKNDNKEINEFYESAINNILITLKNVSKLNGHSNIISIENFMVKRDDEKNKWYLFLKMEYATPLFEYLKKNTFTEKDLIRLAMGMCNALSSLHDANIIHENIKETNIFISKNNTFKISDFNLLKELQSEPILDSSVIPPEIAEGKSFTKISDIYSLGLVLYKLCNNGNLPFIVSDNKISENDIQESVVNRLSGKELPKPLNASESLAKVILKACAFDSNLRYKKVDDMKNDLKKVLQLNEASQSNKFNSELITKSVPINDEASSNNQNKMNRIFGNNENTINYLPIEDYKVTSKNKKSNMKFILLVISVLIIGIILLITLISKNFYNTNLLNTKIINSIKHPIHTRNLTTPTPSNNSTANANKNLIKNFDAEDTNEINKFWLTNTLRAKGLHSISNEEFYTGAKSLKIKLDNNLLSGQYSEMTFYQSVKVVKGTSYKLSLYIKTLDISKNNNGHGNRGAFAIILYYDNQNKIKFSATPYIGSNTNWLFCETTAKIPLDSTSDSVSIHVGISDEIGTAYFDSIKLEQLDTN